MGRARVLIASCLWIAVLLSPSWATDPGGAQQGGEHDQGVFSLPHPFFPSEEQVSSASISLKGSRLASLETSPLLVLGETDPVVRGVEGRYEIDLGNYSFEFTGGCVPEMKSLVAPQSLRDPKACLGYVNLTIPLSQFHLKGDAFLGQSAGASGLLFNRQGEDQNPKRELFGYQISGGYRFNASLSIQASWGQVVQDYDITREDLEAWQVQAQISLGWRISIIPQLGFMDLTTGDGEKTREEAFYYGARWQISF